MSINDGMQPGAAFGPNSVFRCYDDVWRLGLIYY